MQFVIGCRSNALAGLALRWDAVASLSPCCAVLQLSLDCLHSASSTSDASCSMQDLEAEIYSHVLQHHQPAVAGVADAIKAQKKQADSLEQRAKAVIRTPFAW